MWSPPPSSPEPWRPVRICRGSGRCPIPCARQPRGVLAFRWPLRVCGQHIGGTRKRPEPPFGPAPSRRRRARKTVVYWMFGPFPGPTPRPVAVHRPSPDPNRTWRVVQRPIGRVGAAQPVRPVLDWSLGYPESPTCCLNLATVSWSPFRVTGEGISDEPSDRLTHLGPTRQPVIDGLCMTAIGSKQHFLWTFRSVSCLM